MRDTSAAEYARLARDVYSTQQTSGTFSWQRQNFLFNHNTDGFFAATYKTPRTNKIVVAFRGTDGASDWPSNFKNTASIYNL